MTIDEAIKLQDELLRFLLEVGGNKYVASTKLGIKALGAIKTIRDNPPTDPYLPLPGETEE